MAETLKIGNAQAFWGDSPGAPARLVSQQPDLDFLTLDYLAEVSLSILALQRERDREAGFARDFVDVVKSLIPHWKKGSGVKVVTNAGGLNTEGCARACARALKAEGLGRLKVFVVEGDDVLPLLRESPGDAAFRNLETGESLAVSRIGLWPPTPISAPRQLPKRCEQERTSSSPGAWPTRVLPSGRASHILVGAWMTGTGLAKRPWRGI
jgi:hypothetical protein